MTTNTYIPMSPDINGNGRLFGGTLLGWVDVVAGVEAARHAGYIVSTVSIDQFAFLGPAFPDDLVTITARITWTGRTSLEVRVDCTAQSFGGETRPLAQGFVVFVAMDKSHGLVEVPPFVPETEEEKAEYQRAERRRAFRMENKMA